MVWYSLMPPAGQIKWTVRETDSRFLKLRSFHEIDEIFANGCRTLYKPRCTSDQITRYDSTNTTQQNGWVGSHVVIWSSFHIEVRTCQLIVDEPPIIGCYPCVSPMTKGCCEKWHYATEMEKLKSANITCLWCTYSWYLMSISGKLNDIYLMWFTSAV